MLAANFYRLGRRAACWVTVAVGILLVVALLAISDALPDSPGRFLLGLPVWLGLYMAARLLQGDAYEAHLRQGGQQAGGGSAAGIGLLGLVLFLGMVFGGSVLWQGLLMGSKIDFGGGEEIYYTGGIQEAEVRRVGNVLKRNQFFDGRGAKTVKVSREAGRVIVSFVVIPRAWTDPQVLAAFRDIGQEISQDVFHGEPVTVHLCDENLAVKKSLP
jgi:hypothetical protein